MRAVFAVYKRELALYFRSPIAYAIAFGLLLFFGFLFAANIQQIVAYNQQVAAQMQQGFGQPNFIRADDVMVGNLSTLTFLMFIVAPLLTMRLLSEESREGTLEVLLTLPMGEAAFIVGKFLAAWSYYTVLLALTLVHVLILSTIGSPDPGLLAASYFGAWLYGGAVMSLTMIWSAVTEDQIVAAFLGAATVLVLYLSDGVAIWAGGQELFRNATDFIRELSLRAHYQDTMLLGIVRGHDIAYFILLMLAALFITTRIVETRRWRAS